MIKLIILSSPTPPSVLPLCGPNRGAASQGHSLPASSSCPPDCSRTDKTLSCRGNPDIRPATIGFKTTILGEASANQPPPLVNPPRTPLRLHSPPALSSTFVAQQGNDSKFRRPPPVASPRWIMTSTPPGPIFSAEANFGKWQICAWVGE
jgi:hypothetical protein